MLIIKNNINTISLHVIAGFLSIVLAYGVICIYAYIYIII